MKKFLVMFIAVFAFITSPAQTEKPKSASASVKDSVAYHCPMKCAKDKHYAKKGKCEVCGMKLVKVKS